MRYFFDKDDEGFHINDFCFGSTQFGLAVGFTSDKRGKSKPACVVTRDGGAKWDLEPLPDTGMSAFFLTESLGWLVGEKALWRTEEGGREWKKLKGLKDVNRVFFVDENRGWALGRRKTILQTTDGGRNWTELPAAKEPNTTAEYTSYNWMEWQNAQNGIIIGASAPPRLSARPEQPAWLDPQSAARRRQWPTMLIAIETRDGGGTWKPQAVSAFGIATRFRMNSSGLGLILVRFNETFDYPSEVHISHPSAAGGTSRIFRDRDRMVTDCAWWTPRIALVAAIEPPGQLHQLPVPGKLHLLYSTNLKDWHETKVDYRAFGNAAYLSVADADNVWVATDVGQILQLKS